jgi:hypothetical protein
VIIRERKVINKKRARNDYGCRKYGTHEDSPVDNWLVLLPWVACASWHDQRDEGQVTGFEACGEKKNMRVMRPSSTVACRGVKATPDCAARMMGTTSKTEGNFTE